MKKSCLSSPAMMGNTGHKTGFWIEEFAAPYYALADKGVAITLASPKGGQPPIDPKSADPAFSTPATERFNQDAALQAVLANTVTLDSVRPAILTPCSTPAAMARCGTWSTTPPPLH
jgi:putative intracellular protease/amidase